MGMVFKNAGGRQSPATLSRAFPGPRGRKQKKQARLFSGNPRVSSSQLVAPVAQQHDVCARTVMASQEQKQGCRIRSRAFAGWGGEEDAISARRLVADNAYTAYTYTDD